MRRLGTVSGSFTRLEGSRLTRTGPYGLTTRSRPYKRLHSGLFGRSFIRGIRRRNIRLTEGVSVTFASGAYRSSRAVLEIATSIAYHLIPGRIIPCGLCEDKSEIVGRTRPPMAASLTGDDKEKRVTETDRVRKLEVELCHLRIVFVTLCVTVGAFMSLIVPMYLLRANTCGPDSRMH